MTEKQRMAMMLMPNYRNFIESGDSTRVSVLISMAYLVYSVANAYQEEAVEIMEKHDLVHKKLKTRGVNLTTAFDLYDKEVYSLVNTDESRKHLLEDFDTFRAMCDKFMNIEQAIKKHQHEPVGGIK